MKKNTIAVCMIIYLLAVTLVFSLISILCHSDTVQVYPSEDGTVDLTSINFDKEVASITSDAINVYDGALYTPEDFASGQVTQEAVRYVGIAPTLGNFGTIRILLRLPAGKVYALSAKNTSYAQSLFINGEEYAPVGVTGEKAESVTPKTTRYTEAFYPLDDTTEIILHYSNFVHADTGGFYTLSLGYEGNLIRIEQQKTLQVTVATVVLLTAMLFFFGLFLFFPKSRYLLWFSLACGCIALRGMLTGDKILMIFIPNLNWYLAIRLEYLVTCGMALFSVLYLCGLFPGASNKWAIRGFTVFCALNTAFICMAPPLLFTQYVIPTLTIYVLFGAYVLISIVISTIRKKNQTVLSGVEQILLFTGLCFYLILSALEIYASGNGFYLWGLNYSQVGMIAFLFLNILALSLRFARTESELNKALQSEREMEESNRMLERLDKLKSDYLSNISHEMRTPLMVMSGYAQLTDWQINANIVDVETGENLRIISKEAQRLAELASGLLRVSAEAALERGMMDLKDIFRRTVITCRPILAKRNNHLKINIEEGLPLVKANENMILQVLLNLVINANRHTKGGVICLGAQLCTDESIAVTVEDDGDGISLELLPHVFERNVSDDGGSGLGLPICKDVVEAHGGEIIIENIQCGGARITFTLPLEMDDTEDETEHTVS